MKKIRYLLLALLVAASSACSLVDGSMSSRDYLLENVASWNSATARVNQWTAGDRAQALQQALSRHEPLDPFKRQLQEEQLQTRKSIEWIAQYKAPADAQQLQQHLHDFLQLSEQLFAGMEEVASLPAEHSPEQLESLIDALQLRSDALDRQMEALSSAQQAYAHKHRIDLRHSN